MAERTEPIRQDIDATRSAMTDKLEQIEDQVRDKVDATVSQAKRVVDVRQHVNERPWLAFGAAVTIGYILGSMGDDDGHERHQPAHPRRGEPMRYYATEGSDRREDRAPTHQAQHVRHMEQPPQGQRYQEYSYAPTYQAQSYQAQGYEGRRFADQQGRGSSMGGTVAQIVEPLRHEIGLIAAAAVRSGMRALRDSLRDSIPQFESEYQAAQRERESHKGHESHMGGEEGHARAVGATSGTYGTSGMSGTSGSTGTYGTGTSGTGTSGMSGTSGTSTSGTGDRPAEGTAGRHNEDPFRPR